MSTLLSIDGRGGAGVSAVAVLRPRNLSKLGGDRSSSLLGDDLAVGKISPTSSRAEAKKSESLLLMCRCKSCADVLARREI